MRVLVQCEDKYGCYDLISHSFNIPYMKEDKMDTTIDIGGNTLQIKRGIGNTGLFRLDSNTIPFDVVIFVYDMDSIDLHGSFLTHVALKERLESLVKIHNISTSSVILAPVIFCSETIILHKLDPIQIDFSSRFSSNNTAKMHTSLMEDLLIAIHNDVNDKRFWYTTTKKSLFRKKTTRLFLSDGISLVDTLNILRKNNYSDFNMPFLNWLTSGDICEISNLLTIKQALHQQKLFEDRITKSISSGDIGMTYNSKYYE